MSDNGINNLIYLVGAGPGNPELLTAEAKAALEKSICVIGAPRLLKSAANIIGSKSTLPLIKSAEIVAAIESLFAQGSIAVLLSGDPGFYSGAKNLIADFREKGWAYRVVSGISSLTYFAGRLGVPWENMKVISLHGRTADVVGSVREYDGVFFLTDSTNTATSICRELVDAGLGNFIVRVGEKLSYPDEKITKGTAAELSTRSFEVPNVVMVFTPDIAEPNIDTAESGIDTAESGTITRGRNAE